MNKKDKPHKDEIKPSHSQPGPSRTATLLPRSVIESMRKQAKIDNQRALEILAKQAKA
jgi:hypothetical protein